MIIIQKKKESLERIEEDGFVENLDKPLRTKKTIKRRKFKTDDELRIVISVLREAISKN
jgi:hypothetical protein